MGDSNSTGVFRRPDPDDGDSFEQLYRGRAPSASQSAGTRRMPPVDEDREPPRPRSESGRSFDGSGAKRRRREARRRRRRNVLVTILVLVLVVPGLLYFWLDSRLERVEAFADYEGRPDEQPGTTYMIVGSDSREGLSDEDLRELATGAGEGARLADTVMVLYVPEEGDPTLLSVPRDSLVDIPGHDRQRINAAYSFGGPELLTQTFETNSGVRVDHYVEVGFAGFVDIVDAVGGVELCPDEALEDPKAGLDIEAGCQEMDGATALGYARTRATARADLDRVERQREFFGALMDRATSPGVMFNPFRALPLAMEGTGNFEVDEDDHLRHLVSMGLSMRGDLTTSSVPVVDVPGSGALEWEATLSEEMFTAMRSGDEIPEEALQD